MRILQVLAPGSYGGLERVVEGLASGLVAKGMEVAVALVHTPDSDVAAYTDELEAGGAVVFPIPVAGRSYRLERQRIAAICAEWRPDVLHTHGYRCDVLLADLARRLGIPQVTTVHGFTGGNWKNRLYQRLQKRAFRRLSAVVAVSGRLGRELAAAGVPAERVVVAPNAWSGGPEPLERASARAVLGVDPGGYVIGWVGRLSREKGADVLVDALPHLRDLPITVSICGDGPALAGLQRTAADAGVADRIHWHGAVDNAARLFRAFDAFVLSSRTEGTPIALLEAMAAGIPVVATSVGGVPEVVTDREAILVPPEEPAALAAAIRHAFADRATADARAQAATLRLRSHFASDPWLESYLAVYRRVQPHAASMVLCQA